MRSKGSVIGRTFVVFIVAAMALASAAPARAGWVDDWFTQAVTTNSSAYTGQQRGYLTGGGISVRYQHTTTHPVTVSLPSYSGGCGGIDLFLGGFSFLNTNYLVNTLQNMVSAAPAVAFDLAMKTLCEQCSETLGKYKAIIDRLNNVQLNDCKATKAVVTMAADTLTGQTDQAQTELTKLATDTGLYDLYKDSKDALTASGGPTTVTASVASTATGGDADLNDLLFTAGYLLDKVQNVAASNDSASNSAWNTALVSLVRGYIGDFQIKSNYNPADVSPVDPCPANKQHQIWRDLTDGAAQELPAGGNCQNITDVKGQIKNDVSTWMSGIAGKVGQSQISLAADEQTFIDTIRIPVLQDLKTAKVMDPNGSVINSYISDTQNIIADIYSTQVMADLFEETEKMLVFYRDHIKDKASSNADARPFVDSALENVEALLSRAREKSDMLNEHLISTFFEYRAIADAFFDRDRQFNKIIEAAFVNQGKSGGSK